MSAEYELSYRTLQQIQRKLSSASAGSGLPLLRDEVFSLICLLGSPLFVRLVEIDSSLAHLSELSHRLISLKPDDFDFDPCTGDLVMTPHPYHTSDDDDDDVKRTGKITAGHDSIEELLSQGSQSRKVEVVVLYKVEGGSLGFGVVGLRSDLRGELGIFVQEIQPGGVADRYVFNTHTYLYIYTLLGVAQ